MEIKKIQNQNEWEQFVSAQENTSVLQSWQWKQLMENEGQPTTALFVLEASQPVAAALITKVSLPGGMSYLYCPRGPIFKTGLNSGRQASLVEFVAKQAGQELPGAIFFRCDAALPDGAINYHAQGFTKANKESQPRDTIIVDIAPSEEDILKNMKPKARYNIKLAEKKGVKISQGTGEAGINAFYDLLKKTTERNNFSGHNRKYYLDMWKQLSPDKIRIYLAEFEGKTIAGLILTIYGKDAIYLHGASDYEHRHLMAPHLLQWTAMKDAKQLGCATYDLWGVAPENADDSHPWQGITRFKEGFGGKRYRYAGTFDFVYSKPMYVLFNFIRAIRRKVR